MPSSESRRCTNGAKRSGKNVVKSLPSPKKPQNVERSGRPKDVAESQQLWHDLHQRWPMYEVRSTHSLYLPTPTGSGRMPSFACQECGTSFEVPQKSIDKYPNWVPKFCRSHTKKKASAKSGRKKTSRSKGATREENLTLAEVLTRYTEGPDTGVFTDGSASPNPGPGGWGMVWVEGGEIQAEQRGHESSETTNNRMELSALISAYESLPEDARVPVYTDSKLCVDTITTWAFGWERRDWTRPGKPLKNLDLVQPLFALYKAHTGCPLKWIEAHAGYRWNEYADSLATAWMRSEA